jgi:hypothetical protein
MIIFTSNSINSFKTYRLSLFNYLNKKGHKVKFYNIFKAIIFSFKNFKRKNIIVSSDGQTNIMVLLFTTCPAVIILNGLGRYQKIKIIRALIIALMITKKNKMLCVQNYRDFRYLRRFISSSKISWIPGSGGIKRKISKNKNNYLMVARESKMKSLNQKLKKLDIKFEIDIIGLKSKWKKNQINSLGRKKQENIFIDHSQFIQLYLYGEGTPHSLVDALASKMPILMDKISFINFGFYQKYKNYHLKKNLIFLDPNRNEYQDLINMTKLDVVNEKYIKNIIRLY